MTTPLEIVSDLVDALGGLAVWDEVIDGLRTLEDVEEAAVDDLARELCLLDAAARRVIRQLEHRVVLR